MKYNLNFDVDKVATPSFVIDEDLIKANLRKLEYAQNATGAKILLALKGFAAFEVFPLLSSSLSGVCASGLFEARLGREEFRKEVHVFSPAYKNEEFSELLQYADYFIFNSANQWHKFKDKLLCLPEKKCGIRVNPEYSEVKVDLYNPCAPKSRFGIKSEDLKNLDLNGISGLHFHAMCEQNSDTLERILKIFEEKFSFILPQMQWLNFGGGHHITREDYDIEKLCDLLNYFKKKYNVQIYLEPGEAVVLNAGFLVATVLDIIENDGSVAVLDCSAETHMPDVLAMPYQPEIINIAKEGKHRYTYRLTGISCLAGDIIGDYSFKKRLKIGDRLVFTDMAHYSMVKTTMFNGINLPSIFTVSSREGLKLIKKYNYQDYKQRLS